MGTTMNKNFVKLCVALVVLFFLSSCKFQPKSVLGSEGGTNNGSTCATSSYEGPNSSPQTSPFCQAAWSYLKNGSAPTSQEVAGNCAIYEQWQIESPSTLPCPYCDCQ